MNNSPYVLVKGRMHQELVREGDPSDIGFKHNGSLSMHKTLGRQPFIKMAEPVNDMRFGLSDTYDKSTYLTNVPRPKSLVPFEGFDSRKGDLIAKGGNSAVDLKGKAQVYYDPEVKLKAM